MYSGHIIGSEREWALYRQGSTEGLRVGYFAACFSQRSSPKTQVPRIEKCSGFGIQLDFSFPWSFPFLKLPSILSIERFRRIHGVFRSLPSEPHALHSKAAEQNPEH